MDCSDIGNASLRRKQYTLSESKQVHVCYHLICKKTLSQLETFEAHSELPERERAMEIFNTSTKWLELPDLPRWKDNNYIRQFEGRLAGAYFESMHGTPIKWDNQASKSIQPHWKRPQNVQTVSPIIMVLVGLQIHFNQH
jgi:hypothetical protein